MRGELVLFLAPKKSQRLLPAGCILAEKTVMEFAGEALDVADECLLWIHRAPHRRHPFNPTWAYKEKSNAGSFTPGSL